MLSQNDKMAPLLTMATKGYDFLPQSLATFNAIPKTKQSTTRLKKVSLLFPNV